MRPICAFVRVKQSSSLRLAFLPTRFNLFLYLPGCQNHQRSLIGELALSTACTRPSKLGSADSGLKLSTRKSRTALCRE